MHILFKCSDGTFVSTFHLVDGAYDCIGGDDESTCSPQGKDSCLTQHVYCNSECKALRNTCHELMHETYMGKCEKYFSENIYASTISSIKIRWMKTCSGYSCLKSKCIYEIFERIGNRSLCYCKSGIHLEDCENHKCPQYTYKCRNLYCVKLAYLCDGFWDCPMGHDELWCNKSSSPGFYKCKNSSIYISLENICDSFPDCPISDDEQFSDLNMMECPAMCSCLLYSASCHGMTKEMLISISPVLTYMFLSFCNCTFHHSSTLPHQINSLPALRYLIVLNCNITILKFVSQKKHFNMLMFDLSQNIINLLSKKCVFNFPNLTQFSVAQNRLKKIYCHAFSDSNKFAILNISTNLLTYLDKCTFAGIRSIRTLDLRRNLILTLHQNSLNRLHISVIMTSNHVVCCLSHEHLGCNITVPWSFSCKFLLTDISMKIVIWVNGLIGSLGNLMSFVTNIYHLKSQRGAAFSTLACAVSIPDFSYSLSLLLLGIFDIYIGPRYAIMDYFWRRSFGCYTIAFLFLFSNYYSLYIINILAISRFDVVRLPVRSKFKDVLFCFRIQIPGLVTSFFLSLSLFVVYLVQESDGQLQIGLCFLIGRSKYVYIQMFNTISLITLQAASCCTAVTLYSLLVHRIRLSQMTISSSRQVSDRPLLATVILTCFIHVMCWVSSSWVFLISLMKIQYSYKLLIWMVISVNSLNALSNPFLLNRGIFNIHM